MQTQKWVNLGLLIGVFAVFLFLQKLTTALWDLFRFPVPEGWVVEPAHLASFAVAAGAGLWARRNPRANGFFNEVVLELSKVTWPNRKETVASAGVVIVLVAIASLILFMMDTLWGTMIKGVLSL